MAINKISDATRSLIREKSVLSLPDRPSEKGYSAQQLKEYFTNLVLGDQGALTEIDRIVDEINELVGDISDTTIKNYVLDSIVSKLIEQSPYIGLSIVNNKLKYTKFGSPNITGELDYIPEDSVFFNGEYLTNKSKENILPKTSIDKLIDTIDNKTVREYILYLNSRINELLGKHNSEISTINSNIESILGGDAPDALNSIKELAEALKNNPSQVDNILLQLSNLNSDKVDKVDGKQLSTNDYDNASKSFVDSLRSKNLVEVENLKTDLKQFNDDSEHRLVTDVEKATWNSKANSIHSHEINDVNGLQDALNSKSASNHTHTADDIGAEKIGVAAGLIDSHNKSTTAHEDIRKILSELTNKVDGINSAISFETELELSNWLSGNFTRSDGLTPSNLFVGQHIYIKDQDENDYWVSVVPVSSISDLSVLHTDKINLEDYAQIDDLKRVAFTGSCKDLIDFPTIPSSLAEMTEDENHKVITQEKLTLIDTNASNILNKLDKNLGSGEANKMLITDSNGNIITALAGSMSALIDSLDSTSTTMAPTANQVRILNNNKLDKQQGAENANKYLYVNSLGLIDLAAIKTKLSEFENDNSYQTLTEVEKLIAAIPTPDVSGQIKSHNEDEESHQDIRDSIPVVTNDLTNALKNNYDAAYSHSQSAHAPTTVATTASNGLMSSTDKSNVDANTTARHTHSNKTALDAVTIDWMNSLASQTFVTEKINQIPTPDVSGQISTHNSDSSAHQDIRNLIDTKISSLINGAPTTLDTLKEIADAMSANKTVVDALEASIGSKANTSDLANYIPQGGTLSKPLKVTGGDQATAGKIMLDQNNKGQITNTSTQTLFGFTDSTTLAVGHSNYILALRGSGTRPKFNSKDVALSEDIPDTSGFVPNSRTVNGKPLSANITLGNKDVGALPDYTLTINHGTAGNPRMVKFASVNYSSAATCFKMGAMTCHDNGVSYQFLTDMLIAVTTAGEVTANIYKFAQSSVGNVDGVARYTGDVFYVNDTTNKTVDFYILCGQYSSSQFTPATKVGSTTINYVTQYSGTATYYSSGDKVWANGCGGTYVRSNDVPKFAMVSESEYAAEAIQSGTIYFVEED